MQTAQYLFIKIHLKLSISEPGTKILV